MISKRSRTVESTQVGEVLRYGETISNKNLVHECNLFWVKERNGIECYYQNACGAELQKLTKPMCSQLWDLGEEHLHVRLNDQILPNGVNVIPIVSPSYLGKQPLKEQCAYKIAKQSICTLNTTLRFYNYNTALSSTVPASRIVIPTGTLTSRIKNKKTNRSRNPEQIRAQLIEYLESLRATASVQHLRELNDNAISRISTVGELVNLTVECGDGEMHINIAKYLICLYHLLFPVATTTN
tara:strand:+ start:1067 stop:1786 length:720 start_codon:yes stop_codon:yes gene_type:complete